MVVADAGELPTPNRAGVRELHARALAAGATEVMGLTEQDCGSLDFAVQDTEGVLWSVGTYRGADSE